VEAVLHTHGTKKPDVVLTVATALTNTCLANLTVKKSRINRRRISKSCIIQFERFRILLIITSIVETNNLLGELVMVWFL
jgi:hypothetical protein